MKKFVFSLLLVLALLVSCSGGPRVGECYVATEDFPAADCPENMRELYNKSIKGNDREAGMRMYYLGLAFRVASGDDFRVVNKEGALRQIDCGSNRVYWTYEWYIEKNARKK